MRRKISLVLLVLFTALACVAQKPDQILTRWSDKSPIEKIYLHFDRDNYIAGETAWFKAYLYSQYQPDTISTSLFVELVKDSGVISRVIVPILLGTSTGQFELPDSLIAGSYTVRAYTVTMLNHDADHIGKQQIFIHGKNSRTALPVKEKMTRLEFFPEGGNLVSAFTNTIAFKSTNENGLPAAVKGNLLNEKNEVLAIISSYHDGMGMFEFLPAPNEKYYVILDDDAEAKKFYLPGQTEKGIALTIIPHPQGNFFELKQRKNDPAFQAAYMIGQMQHHVVFKQDFPASKEEIQGVINTQNLHSGILQITFFNKDDQPLAERLCFVNNKEYIQKAELLTDTVNFSVKGRNRFSIQLRDTVVGSFSVSITDPEYSLSAVREENIFSRLLLSSDLKGYIHQPGFYFSSDNDSVETARDLVMMTNGWRRFKWTELSQKAPLHPAYKDPAFITLTGKVTLRDTKKPFAESPLLLLLITEDSTRSMQMISTDKQGNFILDSLLFFGKSRILFSDIRGKKSKYIDVTLTDDSIGRSHRLPVIPVLTGNRADLFSKPGNPKIGLDYDAILQSKGLMLEGVTVRSRKKNPIEELEEKYASGVFSGDANKILDLVNNKDAETYNNIFDYLQSRVPGLQINSNGPDYDIYYRQMPTISALGNIPMTLYLDEIETDASLISTIPANQVAMVKIFGSFVAAAGNGAGGVMAIYTKKGSDMNEMMRFAATITKYNGYSVSKEFYAPDYVVDKAAKGQPDNRITLEWRPNILVNNVNPKIPVTFYNNDRTKSFKIVVEGMTLDGRMLMLEKTITGSREK